MFLIFVNSIFLGLIAIFYITISTLSVLIMFLVRSVLFFNKDLQHKFTMIVKHSWLCLTSTILCFYFPKDIYICYDKLIFRNNCNQTRIRNNNQINRIRDKYIILSNHYTNFDWIFILCAFRKMDFYENLVIILKESLSHVPIYGYGMKVFGYIFLSRNWSKDREILDLGLQNLKQKEEFYLLLFPEGTIICSETHEKSKKFCMDNQISVSGTTLNNQKSVKGSIQNSYITPCKNIKNNSNFEPCLNSVINNNTNIYSNILHNDEYIKESNNNNSKLSYDKNNTNNFIEEEQKNFTVSSELKTDHHITEINVFKDNNYNSIPSIPLKNDSSSSETESRQIISQSQSEIFIPNNVLLPRIKGFNMIIEQMNNFINGIVDITLLVDPYCKYPFDDFSFKSIFLKRSKQKLNFHFLLEFYTETNPEEKWLYSLYKEKDILLDDYIEMTRNFRKSGMEFDEFKGVTKKLIRKTPSDYIYTSIKIHNKYSKYFFLLFIAFYGAIFYGSYFLINK
ncbi:hypothetical protein EDEG_00512 [Edhazardia aedis USNM 41457]|uniref:Phospholipid/glycerol acyltransferase domain-containing protein n=1 Tax=Edhazardia aedis (strain USNM 41457) TaxID=1003232 RepID=J9DFB2_EDHAE|nr:hypothetical protein EDEG_00512 [Edhazardia aedis USNM 41457]|eukprot:EJW01295.1 hypothetical protein EDEG_00512 [Edhazardia aedis USNM 41457]